MLPHLKIPILALLAGLVGVVGVTFLFSQRVSVNASTAGFFYLMVVLGVATAGGFWVSAIVSMSAMLCYNYFFLPPVGQLVVADPENWVALFTFLVTALVASHLSDRAQKQALEAKRRQMETEQLYALSRAILMSESARPIGPQATQSIAQIFQLPFVIIYDSRSGSTFRGGPQDVTGVEDKLHEVVRLGSHMRDGEQNLEIWPIALGGNPVGALGAKDVHLSDGAMQSVLNLVAIALERVRMEAAANRAEVARESEEFKSTLLDAIAHEFKTPLTSIKAAATGLQDLPPAQQDLAQVIVEEADRLSQLVSEAVKIAEVEAGNVKLNRRITTVAEIVQGAAGSFQGRGGERLRVGVKEEGKLKVDVELVILALRQLLDNALKYTDAVSPVTCEAAGEDGRLVIRVTDEGPGIPEQDREKVFDKFYRRASVRSRTPGSGMGLHIAREIARSHGGDLWMEPAVPHGSVFLLSLPMERTV
ncbi:MAG: DUF4118 domain-containing protein [Acidobacteria bacterium]|nr:DUF4118 domain-containing protein [Acidobacteriota bacterium]